MPRIAGRHFDDVFGPAFGNDLAAAIAALGAEIDDPIRRLDHFEIMLDHDDRIAVFDKLMQHFEKLRDVVEMQACRRLVENVKRAARRTARQLLRELDALRLAA